MNNLTFTLLTALLLAPLTALHAAEDDSVQLDLALQPAHVIVSPWPQFIPPTKRQGVPGIERTAKGRLWAIYGRDVESTRTYQVLKTSADDGQSWSEVQLMVLPREGTRAMSANVWIDPLGRLWLFWGQTSGMNDGRFGVWATYEGGFEHLLPMKGRLKTLDLSMSVVNADDLKRVQVDHPDAKIITIPPAEIVKRHSGVADRLARIATGPAAEELKKAIEMSRKK